MGGNMQIQRQLNQERQDASGASAFGMTGGSAKSLGLGDGFRSTAATAEKLDDATICPASLDKAATASSSGGSAPAASPNSDSPAEVFNRLIAEADKNPCHDTLEDVINFIVRLKRDGGLQDSGVSDIAKKAAEVWTDMSAVLQALKKLSFNKYADEENTVRKVLASKLEERLMAEEMKAFSAGGGAAVVKEAPIA